MNRSNHQINNSILIGIGNIWRNDDGLGPHIVSSLLKDELKNIDIQILSGEMSKLLDLFRLYKNIYIVDAFHTGSEPGTIFNLTFNEIKLGSSFESSVSSHGMGLWKALKMAEVLGLLPIYLEVFGIEGENFDHGNKLSHTVTNKLEDLKKIILNKITGNSEHA